MGFTIKWSLTLAENMRIGNQKGQKSDPKKGQNIKMYLLMKTKNFSH